MFLRLRCRPRPTRPIKVVVATVAAAVGMLAAAAVGMLPAVVAISVAAVVCVAAAVARVTSAPDRQYPVRLRGLARASTELRR